jgi:DNA polymerase-3 subunit gamma/tau
MLYNKWRPAVFADVYGQPHITETLLAQLKAGRVAHAYLFTGSRGTGKTSCAKILARAVNCRCAAGPNGGWDGEPCNQCESCLGILNGSAPDFTEIDAASNSGVDNIRALRDELVYSPVADKKRVYIIDEVHMLSTGAFNALLKTLEEPPEHVLFILATTETHKVPATIVSRCQRFSFRRISTDVILSRIGHICEQEDISIDADAISLIAQMADGSFRDALSLLEQCTATGGHLTEESVREIVGLAGLGELTLWLREMDDLQKSMGHLERHYQAGLDAAAILGQLSALLRDLLMGQMLGDLSVTRLPSSEAQTLSAQWPRERILRALTVFTETRLSRSAHKKLEAELCMIRLACVETIQEEKTDQPSMKKPLPPVLPPKPETLPEPVLPPEPALPPETKPKPEIPAKKEAPAKKKEPPQEAALDPRWAELLKSLNNPMLEEAFKQSGAQIDGDRLVIRTDDPYIQGVVKQAEKQILKVFPGGAGSGPPAGNSALDALLASERDLVIEE